MKVLFYLVLSLHFFAIHAQTQKNDILGSWIFKSVDNVPTSKRQFSQVELKNIFISWSQSYMHFEQNICYHFEFDGSYMEDIEAAVPYSFSPTFKEIFLGETDDAETEILILISLNSQDLVVHIKDGENLLNVHFVRPEPRHFILGQWKMKDVILPDLPEVEESPEEAEFYELMKSLIIGKFSEIAFSFKSNGSAIYRAPSEMLGPGENHNVQWTLNANELLFTFADSSTRTFKLTSLNHNDLKIELDLFDEHKIVLILDRH